MGHTRLLPCPKVIPHKRVPGHMEAWILVVDIYPTRGTVLRFVIDSGGHDLVRQRVWTNAFLTCSRVCQTLMWQTVSDCRSRWSRWLLVMYSCALQSPVVCLNTYSVETQSPLSMQLHVVLLSVLSGTLVVLEWFYFKLTTCSSRRVAKLTWIYCSVKKLCRWQML